MKKFELFVGCFGNGTSYSNKAVIENGDYKKLCHVSKCGKITWYVRPDSIPGSALLRIEHDADATHLNFIKWLESMDKYKQYEYLLNNVPLAAFLNAVSMEGLDNKIEYLKNELCSNAPY